MEAGADTMVDSLDKRNNCSFCNFKLLLNITLLDIQKSHQLYKYIDKVAGYYSLQPRHNVKKVEFVVLVTKWWEKNGK